MGRLKVFRPATTSAVLACAALLAACGSSSTSSSSGSSSSGSTSASASASSGGVATAKAAIEAAKAAPSFVAPGPAFNAAKAKGKTIALIPDYSSLPFVQEINQGLLVAAKDAGVKVNDCPNAGTVGAWVKCFDQAITSKPDLIVLNGSPSPSQLQPQIKAANAAHIPVIANHVPLASQFPAGTLPPTNTAGLAGVEAGPFTAGAKLMADYAVANQPDGKVNALILTSNEAPASVGLVKMIQNELAAACGSNCKSTVVNVPIVDWSTKLEDATRTALLRDPTLNWVIPIYDGAFPFVLPGVQGSGRASSIKTVSFNGQGAALTAIQSGKATATVGEDLAWTGWSTMDQALRILATGKANPITKADTPVRVWDKSDIKNAGTPAKPTVGYSTTFEHDYLKLWGLAK